MDGVGIHYLYWCMHLVHSGHYTRDGEGASMTGWQLAIAIPVLLVVVPVIVGLIIAYGGSNAGM